MTATLATIGMLCTSLVCCDTTSAAEDREDRGMYFAADQLAAHLASIDAVRQSAHSEHLSPADLEALHGGDAVVKVLDASKAAAGQFDSKVGVLGVKVVAAPQLLVWQALVTDSEELDGRLTRAVLQRRRRGAVVRYQHMNLPWPISDRHWVIDVSTDVATAAQSDGVTWERHWQLSDDGPRRARQALSSGLLGELTEGQFSRSIFLPANEGALVVSRLDAQRSLVVAELDIRLGGRIADGLVRRFSRRELRKGLDALPEIIAGLLQDRSPDTLADDGRGEPVSSERFLQLYCGWRTPTAGDSCPD